MTSHYRWRDSCRRRRSDFMTRMTFLSLSASVVFAWIHTPVLLFDCIPCRYNKLCQKNLELDAEIVKAKSHVSLLAWIFIMECLLDWYICIAVYALVSWLDLNAMFLLLCKRLRFQNYSLNSEPLKLLKVRIWFLNWFLWKNNNCNSNQ